MTVTGTLNLLWSQAMIAGFVAAGVTDAVISPGSRSTPLALAILRQPGLNCHVAIDERSAGFFGLGLAKASQRPVILLATSGTAPANWLPAAIEASQSGVPLLLISADRPPELQGWGSNQTIDQQGLFGSHVRASHNLGVPEPGFDPAYLYRLAAQACEQATWPHPGPIHINQPFREPLFSLTATQPSPAPEAVRITRAIQAPSPEALRELAGRISGRPGFIVCGEMPNCPGQSDAIIALARQLACPILAEPLSGLRYGQHDRSQLVARYCEWSAATDRQAEWVIRFGSFPVTRQLQSLVAGVQGTHVLVEAWPRWTDPQHRVTHLVRADIRLACEALLKEDLQAAAPDWLHSFRQWDASAHAASSPSHVSVLLDELPDNSALFVGNSLAIREVDRHAWQGDKTIHFFANRGASGIDGNIATAVGIAATRGRVVALIGDLTCQHDIGSLALAARHDVVIVTVNNGGGGIFDYLPQRQLAEFDQAWRTPQQISFAHAAQTFGLAYACASDNASLRHTLRAALSAGGPHLIELKLS